MTKRHHKHADGKFHIHGHKYGKLIGSRAEVMHNTAYKTVGGLTKAHLKRNKHGKIVSRAKSAKGPALLKRLTDKGYYTRKGTFGFVTKDVKGKTHKRRKSRRRPKRRRRRSRRVTIRERRGRKGRFMKYFG
jgi:hypothetical protein